MAVKRMTAHRKMILAILDDDLSDCGGCPPYAASSVHWELERMHRSGAIATLPTRRQLYRTLRDLWNDGLIVASRQLADPLTHLPYWELHYEVVESVERNTIVSQCIKLHAEVKKARIGTQFFATKLDGEGATKEQVEGWTAQARSLGQRIRAQKTDKGRFSEASTHIAECLKRLKSMPLLPS